MRPSALIAAALGVAASLALVAPANAAALTKVTATSSCSGGARVKLVSTLDSAGTQRGKAIVSGATTKRWTGELVLGLDDQEAAGETTINDLVSGMQTYHPKHGTFGATAEYANARGLDAMAVFSSRDGVCMAATVVQGSTKFAVSGSGGGVMVNAGSKSTVMAFAVGEQHHRYRFTVTVRTKAGVKRWSEVRTVSRELDPMMVRIHDVKHLSSFTQASVTVTDLSHRGEPMTYKDQPLTAQPHGTQNGRLPDGGGARSSFGASSSLRRRSRCRRC